ncbi:MAG: LPS-assembly protein LptD [Thiobacillaceae bacterium]
MLTRLCAQFAVCLVILPVQQALCDEPPLILKLDTRLRGSAVAGPEGPLFIAADRIESTRPDIVEAHGHVEARQAGKNFFADFLRYDKELNQVKAKGNVRFEQAEAVINGESLFLKLDTYSGEMIKPEFELMAVPDLGHTDHPADSGNSGIQSITWPGRGHADRADFQDQDHFSLKQALYTTCPIDDEAWKLNVNDLDIDQAKNVGTAHGALLTFQDVPLLYTPWMNFPLDNKRKSGLLAPTFGTTSANGVEFTLPYYFNLAPNYDATFSPRYLSKRGLQLGGEGRYLMDSYKGSALLEFLDDQAKGRNRWAFLLQHEQQIDPTLIGKIDLQRVSDKDYFRDLSTLVVQTSQTLLPEQGTLDFANGLWQGQFLAQQFQLLQDPNSPITAPYARLPDITLKTVRSFGAFEGKLDSDFTYFQHPSQTNGARLIVYPQVKLPWENSFATANATFGINASYYALDNSAPKQSISRVLPISSLDGGFAMDRDFAFAGKQYQQTLEPRVYYVYIPYRDQSQIPVFDTARMDLNLDTLFSPNQYIGGDRINNANQLTMALTSRFIDSSSGQERLSLTLGQRYYFNSQLVTLPGETPTDTQASALVAAFDGKVTPNLRVDGNWEYNNSSSTTLLSNLSSSYIPGPGRLLNLGYRYVKDSVKEIDLSSQWPLTRRLSGLTRINYSVSDVHLVNGLLGFEYNGGCWGIRSVIQRLTTAQNTQNNAFFIQLILNGLGQLGSNPIDTLKQNIPGYATPNSFIPQPHP